MGSGLLVENSCYSLYTLIYDMKVNINENIIINTYIRGKQMFTYILELATFHDLCAKAIE